MRMKVNGNSKNNITGYAKRNRSMLIFILLTYVLNVGFLITGTQIQLPLYKQKLRSLEPGQVADFQVKAENEVFYIDAEKTEELKEQQASTVLPVYTINEAKVLNLISHFERFASFYMVEGRELSPQELIEELSMRFPNRFGTQDIEILADAEDLPETLPLIEEELRTLLENGVFPSDVKTAQNGTGVLQLWHWEGNEKLHEEYTQKNIISENEIESIAQQKLGSYNFEGETEAAAVILLSNFAEQTAYYNATLTTALKNQAR